MVYERRHVPGVVSVDSSPSNPGSNPSNEVARGVAPVRWSSGKTFDIGQLRADGSYTFDGLHLVNIEDMTAAQLDAASKETNRDLKRGMIEETETKLMLSIANSAETPSQFVEGCWDEPYLNRSEAKPFDTFLGEEFITLEGVIEVLEPWVERLQDERWAREVLRDQIQRLGGKAIEPPTPEDPVPSEVDKVKEKIGEVEKHLVPEPGTPVTPEDLVDPWPKVIPELPTLPVIPPDGDIADVWLALGGFHTYLTDLRAYHSDVLFNMGWCIEMIKVCLLDLQRAKAPGTQEDAFKANFAGLQDGSAALEIGGVFHD